MFNRKLESDDIRYESSNRSFKISDVSFCYSLTLLQVFGAFRGHEKLRSFDMGIWGAITVDNILVKVSCEKISMDQLDHILNELELIEPAFKTIKTELRATIQEKTLQKNIEADRKKEEMASTRAALLSLGSALFNGHTQQENDYQKACRLHREGQYEQALEAIKKFKSEEMDNNPYPYNHEKGFSITIGYRAYEVMADCYRRLHRYGEAQETLEDMISNLHPVLTQASVRYIVEMKKAWKIEADEHAANQTVNAALQSLQRRHLHGNEIKSTSLVSTALIPVPITSTALIPYTIPLSQTSFIVSRSAPLRSANNTTAGESEYGFLARSTCPTM